LLIVRDCPECQVVRNQQQGQPQFLQLQERERLRRERANQLNQIIQDENALRKQYALEYLAEHQQILNSCNNNFLKNLLQVQLERQQTIPSAPPHPGRLIPFHHHPFAQAI
jgi:hypothetical protein